LPAPTLIPLDFALPFDFGDDLAWLDNLGFISETSQPLDASSNNVSLANTVLNNNPGGTEFQYDGTGELDWLFANVIQGGGHFVAPSSQLDWNANGPDLLDPSSSTGARGIVFEGWDTDTISTQSELPILLPPPVSSPYSFPAASQVISPPPIEALNADVDERNIVHSPRTRNPTKRALETVGTAVQSRAKKPRSKRVSSCVVFVYRCLFAYSSLGDLQLWFGVHQMNYLRTCIFFITIAIDGVFESTMK
jgi:hypothetical protein